VFGQSLCAVSALPASYRPAPPVSVDTPGVYSPAALPGKRGSAVVFCRVAPSDRRPFCPGQDSLRVSLR